MALAVLETRIDKCPSWGYLAVVAARIVWDEERWHTIAARQLQSCREAGLLARLVISVNAMAVLTVWRGDFAEVVVVGGESWVMGLESARPTRTTKFQNLANDPRLTTHDPRP